jgi:hypothetical protein
VVQQEAGLGCIRADDISGSGFDLLEKIHIAIEKAELVIAEVSDKNPNVFYELGYAVGIQKPVLLLAQAGIDMPSDLRGRELILHSEDKHGVQKFTRDLSDHIHQRLNSQVALLRDMLESEQPQPVFIVAGPKYPTPGSRILGQARDERTFGDNLGVLGLVSAFGSIFGETNNIELVSGQYCSPELPERDVNLFLIGSPRVNVLVDGILKSIQYGSQLNWKFSPTSGAATLGSGAVTLYRVQGDNVSEIVGQTKPYLDSEMYTEDYGIIVRAPHPKFPARFVMVIAGAHSLGTGAACLAATRSALIQRIKLKIDIAQRKQAFWVLVKGIVSGQDGLLDVEGVSVEDAGLFSKVEMAKA